MLIIVSCFRIFQDLYQQNDTSGKQVPVSKEQLKEILKLACSDREQECIRYTAYQASGLSAKAAKNHYGLENMDRLSVKIDYIIEERKQINDAVNNIAAIQEKALLLSYGVRCSDSDDSSSDVSDSEPEVVSMDTEHLGSKENVCQEKVTSMDLNSCNIWMKTMLKLM